MHSSLVYTFLLFGGRGRSYFWHEFSVSWLKRKKKKKHFDLSAESFEVFGHDYDCLFFKEFQIEAQFRHM